MGKVTGFKEFDRKTEDYRPVELRIKDYGEIFTGKHNIAHLQEQGARCMDCGVPFCQSENGCPVDNLIPEWNDLVYHDKWQEALIRYIKLIISQNLLAEFVRLRVKDRAYLE